MNLLFKIILNTFKFKFEKTIEIQKRSKSEKNPNFQHNKKIK